jgi:hypothetical protein
LIDFIGTAPLQRPPSVNRIPQALVLPQHARGPQHLRHAVVGEGCQEANVVKLAHPQLPPPPQQQRWPSAAHRLVTAICAYLWKYTTDVRATPLAASHPQERVTAINVVAKARERVKYDPHEGVSAAVGTGYHVQGDAVVAPQQAIAKLVQMRAPDLHVQEAVAAAAHGRGRTPSPAGVGKCGHSRERSLGGIQAWSTRLGGDGQGVAGRGGEVFLSSILLCLKVFLQYLEILNPLLCFSKF